MPNNKQKNIGTSSLKVKPKKHRGFIKQLSQPFFLSNKRNKNVVSQEPTGQLCTVDNEALGLFASYDDLFLFDRKGLADSVFHSLERKDLETLFKFDSSSHLLDISQQENGASSDSGYTSPPCLNDMLSNTLSAPCKGILKKNLSVSPTIRSESPYLVAGSEGSSIGNISVQYQNGLLSCRDCPMPQSNRAMSPLGMESIENALGFLDDVIDQENGFKRNVKKSVSFGEMAEVKNYHDDSSDNIDLKSMKKSVYFGEMKNDKRTKDTINECNKALQKNFEDIHSKREHNGENVNDCDPYEKLLDMQTETSELSVSEKSESKSNIIKCGCDTLCQFEVEVKVIDIQPQPTAQGKIDGSSSDKQCIITELDNLNVLICHHPGCTKDNKNKPVLLCKECDINNPQQLEYSSHLALDMPQRKTNSARTSRIMHTHSTPVFSNVLTSSTDMDVGDQDDKDIDNVSFRVAMETDTKNDSEAPRIGETNGTIMKKKMVKAKRRHTTGLRSHSASDIFTGPTLNSDDEVKEHHFRYHGSIDENTFGNDHIHRLSVFSNQAQSRVGKGMISYETFTLKIHNENGDEDTEIVAAEKNVSLRESIQPILERRKLSLDEINLFVEASNTPLPLTCDTFLLGGTTMYIKQKDGNQPVIPIMSRSLSKATGSKFVGSGKSSCTKSKSGGSLQSRHGILADDSFSMALSSSISPQGTLRELDNHKQKQPSKLTNLFSPLNKDKEKQEQLNDLLSSYSTNGLPPLPPQAKIGKSQPEVSMFEIEENWRLIVHNSEDLTKYQQDQQEAIWELLQTEILYIHSIQVISDLFLCVLLNLQIESILKEIETEKLFNNIGEIFAANSDFWCCHLVKVLEESRNTGKPLNPSLMKEGFQKYTDLFHPYIQYCAKQKMCSDYMKIQYAESDIFKTFVIWAEAQKQCNRLKLTDLFVKPMQRLTKYSLLLHAILRKTEDSIQHADLLEMIGHVDHFVRNVNATLHQKHEEEKLRAIVDKIEPYETTDAPNDECLKLIQLYNCNFNLIAPMPGCHVTQTRTLVMKSPLKMKEYQNRMDVECLLFTDLILICRANKKVDKFKMVKPPMRIDRIHTHLLKDKGSFLLIYLNEYNVPLASFTFHADQNVVQMWMVHIQKAQEMYTEARMSSSAFEKPLFPSSEIVTEEIIGYRPLIIPENTDTDPLFQLHCSSADYEALRLDEITSSINRSRSWNEIVSQSTDPGISGTNGLQYVSLHFPFGKEAATCMVNNMKEMSVNNAGNQPIVNCVHNQRAVNSVDNHETVQYSKSDPSLFNQFFREDGLQVPCLKLLAGACENNMSSLIETIDDSNKQKLYQRRQCRTEKRYHTADTIQEINKSQNRDNSIYKRLSWNFPNGEAASDKQGVLKHKTVSSDSVRSYHSSSGVSSTGSLHLSPEGDISEEECDVCDEDDQGMNLKYEISQDIKKHELSNSWHIRSKSSPDIVSLLKDLNTRDMKDGIGSVNLPLHNASAIKLTPAQLQMKKQLLLSSNVEGSEV